MTTINSLCIKCRNLYAGSGCCISNNGVRSLISSCRYGGKNAGNRKSCKDFDVASDEVIAERIMILEGDKK